MKKMEKVDLAEWIVDRARIHGADECMVLISNQRQVGVEIRENKLEKLEESTEHGLSLSLYVDNRYSSHSTNDMRQEILDDFIAEAIAATRYLSPDPYRSLPDPKYYPGSMDRDLDVLDKGFDSIDTEFRIDTAKVIEASALEQSKDIISVSAGYSDTKLEYVRLHSNGFLGEIATTMFQYGAEVTVRDPRGGRPSDWMWASARHLNDLPDPAKTGHEAFNRAMQKIGQSKIASGKYDMVVENRAIGKLVSMLLGPMSARALQQKSSWMDGMLGKPVASNLLTIYDEPFIERGMGSRLFDSEGMQARSRKVIENGQLSTYLIDNYYGKKLGLEPNSGSLFNLLFDYGNGSLQKLIAGITKGIFISGFLGGNYNPTTGDFSFGIVGQLVENGKVVKPVNEMNISGNARELWQQLSRIGNDPYPWSAKRYPSMMFTDVHFSGL